MTLATQTLKKALMTVEESGINVTQEIKQIDSDNVDMIVHLKKVNKKNEKTTTKPKIDGN